MKKCKNFEECGNYIRQGQWCNDCYYEYHETKEEMGDYF
jgi:ribosomal protein L32